MKPSLSVNSSKHVKSRPETKGGCDQRMHQLIYGLVYDSTREEALEQAKRDVFRPLVEEEVFDYFVTFDEDGRGVAGSDRWGALPAAVEAETSAGEKLIDHGWEATVREYMRSFQRVEEFMEEHDPSAFWTDEEVHRTYLFDFHRIGEFQGMGTFLYDQDGEGIRYEGHLENVRNYWSDEPSEGSFENQELYVVPADVHF